MVKLPSFPLPLPRTAFQILGLASLIFASQMPAAASIIFNDTGSTPPPASFNPGGYAIEGSSLDYSHVTSDDLAAQFTPGTGAELTAIDVYLSSSGSPYSGRVTFAIFSDSNDAPGDQIGPDTWTVTGSATNQVTSIAASGITFTAGTKYWLVGTPTDANTVANWATNSNYVGLHAFGYTADGATDWVVQPPNYASDFMFVIEGNNFSATPEPATWALMLSGALLGIWWKRRPAARSIAALD